ncbi:MAG: MFS transporter [Pseudonocardia sp.]|nr:MFS transporter [Pseudonocardia sp.]
MTATTPTAGSGRHRRPPAGTGPRAMIVVAQLLGVSVWFSASAVVPDLRTAWGIGGAAAVWLTSSVQLGFVAGPVTSAVLTLPDRLRPHRMLALGAAGAATCTVLLALVVDGATPAIALRALTGVFLAGVYPVGMKLTTSWSGVARRGRDLGTLVAALTLGSALPHVLGGGLPWRGVLAGAAVAGFACCALALVGIRPGPLHAPAAPPAPRYVATMLRERAPRLVVLGYLGHMWELYAFWTWLATYLRASAAGTGSALPVGAVVFLTAGIAGAAGCVLGGRSADRWGRPVTAVTALIVSGTCCLLSPVMVDAGPGGMLLFCAVWGAAAVADSCVFTTAMSEAADPRYVGTALTAQTALGFLVTVASIQLVPLVAGIVGWRFALLFLLPGPLLGVPAMLALGAAGRPPRTGTIPVVTDARQTPLPRAARPRRTRPPLVVR